MLRHNFIKIMFDFRLLALKVLPIVVPEETIILILSKNKRIVRILFCFFQCFQVTRLKGNEKRSLIVKNDQRNVTGSRLSGVRSHKSYVTDEIHTGI